jgi:hypothetical protein
MNSKHLYYILIAAIVLVNGGGVAALYLGNKMLSTQTSKLTDLKVEANTLEDVQRSLTKAKKDIVTYSDIEKVVKTVIPQEKDQARTIREIIKIAGDSHIPIASVNFPSSSLGTKNTGGASTPAQSTAGATTQTQKVEGISNVERLEITVASDTSKPVLYTDFIGFLARLEQNRRTSQVTSISIQPAQDNRNRLTFTLILNVYIRK